MTHDRRVSMNKRELRDWLWDVLSWCRLFLAWDATGRMKIT